MTNTLPIPGYEGIYEISKEGRIFSVERHQRNSLGRVYKIPSRERKPSVSMYGYLTVRLSKHNQIKTHRVHRLVAEVFIPNPNGLPYVNHIDGNKQNPSFDNLEWVTAEENSQHAIQSGLINHSGESNPSAKLTDAQVEDALTECLNGASLQDVSLRLGVNRNTLPKRFKYTQRAELWKAEALKRKATRTKVK